MADQDRLIESFSSNDVITSLWNKNAVEKCRIGLADVIVFEKGLASRWYVTGKTGEVTRKRGADMDTISQRWIKIKSQYDSPVVAMLRQDGGMTKFLTLDAWKSFIEEEHIDHSILSLHCFINGENHTVYRNSFKLRDKFGRYSCTTHTYSFPIDRNNMSSVITLHDSQIKLVESKANQIKSILDLATNTIIRYMEQMLNVKIVSMNVDYVVDKKSQIWMLWANDTKFVKAENLPLLNHIPETTIRDREGRMGWAGPKYFEELGNSTSIYSDTTGAPPSPGSTSPGKRKSSEYQVGNDVSLEVAGSQVNTAASVTSQIQKPKTKRNIVAESAAAIPYHVQTATEFNAAAANSFPQPFKCRGDYCQFQVHTQGKLATSLEAPAHHLPGKLFSEKELTQLRKDKSFGTMMEFGSAGPALATMSMRSLILARQERRGLTNIGNLQPWNQYPQSPRSKLDFTGSVSSVSGKASEKDQVRRHSLRSCITAADDGGCSRARQGAAGGLHEGHGVLLRRGARVRRLLRHLHLPGLGSRRARPRRRVRRWSGRHGSGVSERS